MNRHGDRADIAGAVAASRAQARASDPQDSAWVSANAGSGKTHVLVNRVVRLLLTGTPPERILCLTYTKAAAAEMSARLFDELAGWLKLDAAALNDRVRKNIGHAAFDRQDHAAARRLFTRALETPGGLKVQTIHAFCEKLLQRFPVEAGVVPGFEVMDDQAARDLRRTSADEVLASARSEPGNAMAHHLGILAAQTQYGGLDELVHELIVKRRAVLPLIASAQARAGTAHKLHEMLGTHDGMNPQSVMAQAAGKIDKSAYHAAAKTLGQRSAKSDKERGETIVAMIAASSDATRFSLLRQLFLKADGEARADTSVLTKNAARDNPEVADFLLHERDRIYKAEMTLRALRVHAATMALLTLGADILARYEAAKRRGGLYDFDDLVLRTLALLDDAGTSAWVLYKLDGGLDHILIDEAQDTSPEQWQIIRRLTEEFFAGEGARDDVERTVFAVGDRKQSIYSFQGAEPAGFDAMRRHFSAKAGATGRDLNNVPLQVSFRSAPQILELVDEVFAQPEAAEGVSLDGHPADPHEATRAGQAGLVELWPLVTPDEAEPRAQWQAPQAPDDLQHPRVKLARKIAMTIRDWVRGGEVLQPRGRTMRYGDIVILVRSRTTFADALVRALKLHDIPVAGADRLKLTQHIAVEDLLALIRFCLVEQDDLSLAAVLKSPLVSDDAGKPVSEDMLFELAHGRSRDSLWQSLARAARAGKPLKSVYERLQQWRNLAGYATPYGFLAGVLNGHDTRQRILTRLGSEAGEPLDALLNAALDYEQRHVPDLRGFASWLEGTDPEIKRDMDQSGNEVRVMTVHGAKGLEANVVILPDTNSVADGKKVPRILFEGDESIPLWKMPQGKHVDASERLKAQYLERVQQEENRLLYVAMTRACDRLYVCGYGEEKGARPQSWYQLVANVLERDDLAVRGPDGEVVCWRRVGAQTEPATEKAQDSKIADAAETELPDWTSAHPVAHEPVLRQFRATGLPAPDATDQAMPPEPVLSPLQAEATNHFQRGTLIHRLLEILPEVEPERRAAVAEGYLAQPGHGLSQAQQDDICSEALRLLNMEDFTAVFAPSSQAEVPIMAELETPRGMISLTGQIDRLAVTDDEVLIADFKTNRPAPAQIEQADPGYVRQLAAYRLALGRIYPDKRVRAALIWTNTAQFMEIPEAMLDAALGQAGDLK